MEIARVVRRQSPGRIAALVLVLCLMVVVLPGHPAARSARLAVPPLPAAALTAPTPRAEYPRPDFARDTWQTLNGVWDFALDPNGVGESQRWYRADSSMLSRPAGRIIVPFPWQSLAAFGLSPTSPAQVHGPLAGYAGTVWYARRFRIPASFPRGADILLTFGAAEQAARVWVNGRPAGSHEGGYLPVSLDITGLVDRAGPNSVAVAVTQPRDLTGYPHGKQGGSWYTPSGGLWQSVWLEAAGAGRIAALHVTPRAGGGRVAVAVSFSGTPFRRAALTLTLVDPRGTVIARRHLLLAGGTAPLSTTIAIAQPRLWDTDHPDLYHLTATLAPTAGSGPAPFPDTVHTYFGLRTISVGQVSARDSRGRIVHYPYVFLNGRPVFLRGALDQDFNPWGVYTAPSDAFLRDEILRARALGLNFLRIHIKVPDPRLLYWADRLGVLIWEEPPDFAENGDAYNAVTLGRWQDSLRGMIDRDYNHPATIIWGLFNEEWGIGDLRQAPGRARALAGIYAEVKRLDPTRLVVDQSGWSHTRTDLFDVHEYRSDFGSWRVFLDKLQNEELYPDSTVACGCISGSHDGFASPYSYSGQPLIMSEYAAGPWTGDWPNTSDPHPDGFRDNSAPFRWLTNDLRLHPAVAGYIYTQYSDVEWEHNGLMRYDRTPRDFGYAPPGLFPGFVDTATPRSVNGDDYLALDRVPISRADPGDVIAVPVWFSHFGRANLSGAHATLQWRLAGYDGNGAWRAGPIASMPVMLDRTHLAQLATLHVTAPRTAFAGDLGVWLSVRDAHGTRVPARNAVAIVVAPQIATGVAVANHQLSGGPRRTTITWTFEPGDYTAGAFSATGPVRDAGGEAAWGGGSGYLEYQLRVPDGARSLLAQGKVLGLRLQLEAGAETRTRPGDQSAPQTDAQPAPSDLQIGVDGISLLTRILPGDPADTRGILSLNAGYHWGEYGYPLTVQLGAGAARLGAVATRLRQAPHALLVRFAVPPRAAHVGGLALYGETTGRIPAPLSLQLTISAAG